VHRISIDAGKAKACLGFLVTLPLLPGRLGLRQLALLSLQRLSYRRALILSDAATVFPLALIQNLNLQGCHPSAELLIRVSDQLARLMDQLRPVPRPPVGMHSSEDSRPWRSLLTTLLAADTPPELRQDYLNLLISMDEGGAWLLFSYLRLALRKGIETEQIVDGLTTLIPLYRLHIQPRGREMWWPWNPNGRT